MKNVDRTHMDKKKKVQNNAPSTEKGEKNLEIKNEKKKRKKENKWGTQGK